MQYRHGKGLSGIIWYIGIFKLTTCIIELVPPLGFYGLPKKQQLQFPPV